MRKKPKIKYTDMCIYIDNNINKPDADVAKIYDYLVMLSYMLAVKRRFFNREDYYDKFANYFAAIIYSRMTDKRQFLPEDDPCYIAPVKSCLNYMKNIIYARKCAFCYEEFNFTTQTSDAVEYNMFRDNLCGSINNDINECIGADIDIYFNSIDKMVKDKVYKGVYGKDKVLAWNLYVSVLLSLLNNFTLSFANKRKLIDFKKTYNYSISHADCRLMVKNNYEDILTECMIDETTNAVIPFNVADEYYDYIFVIVQQLKQQIVKDIKDISAEYILSDDFIEDVLMSNLNNDGDGNE